MHFAVYYYLQFHMKEIEALGSGTTFKEISKSALQGIEIRLPDLEKQRDIAKCLSDLDRKIELNKQINGNLLLLDHSSRGAIVRLAA